MKILQAMVLMSSSVGGLGVLGCDVFVSGHPPQRAGVCGAANRADLRHCHRGSSRPTGAWSKSRPPAQGYVWIDGYYAWGGRQYTWEPGRWAMPPRGYTVSVAPATTTTVQLPLHGRALATRGSPGPARATTGSRCSTPCRNRNGDDRLAVAGVLF